MRVRRDASSLDKDKATVAKTILNLDLLPAQQRIELLQSLGLGIWIGVDAINDRAMIPSLVENEIIKDSQETYESAAVASLETKIGLLRASSHLEHLARLDLSSDDLAAVLRDDILIPKVVPIISSDWGAWAGLLNSDSATNIVRYLLNQNNKPTLTGFKALASAEVSAELMLNLLAVYLAQWSDADIDSALGTMPPPYSNLISREVVDVEIPDTDASRAILDRLKQSGSIIDHRKSRGRETRRVQRLN